MDQVRLRYQAGPLQGRRWADRRGLVPVARDGAGAQAVLLRPDHPGVLPERPQASAQEADFDAEEAFRTCPEEGFPVILTPRLWPFASLKHLPQSGTVPSFFVALAVPQAMHRVPGAIFAMRPWYAKRAKPANL